MRSACRAPTPSRHPDHVLAVGGDPVARRLDRPPVRRHSRRLLLPRHQHRRRHPLSRRRLRHRADRTQQPRGGGQLLALADPAVRAHGRGAVPYRARAEGDRRHRAADQAGAGRLSVVAVVAGTVFSAISGSTIATTAMLGSLMLPVMLSRGYHPTMAAGPIMAIGAVDMLIPPS